MADKVYKYHVREPLYANGVMYQVGDELPNDVVAALQQDIDYAVKAADPKFVPPRNFDANVTAAAADDARHKLALCVRIEVPQAPVVSPTSVTTPPTH
ncbi:MAG: hypothetical protein NVSMB31_01290 [Vulcanimicrobiaceae bacterium]